MKAQLIDKFLIKDLSPVDRDRTKRIIYLTQTAVIDRIIKELGIKDCKIAKTLMKPEL